MSTAGLPDVAKGESAYTPISMPWQGISGAASSCAKVHQVQRADGVVREFSWVLALGHRP